jgi:predicted amidohydrolase YtcJ
LHKPYSDSHTQLGALITSIADMKTTARKIAASNFQLNTHAGDSANTVLLKFIKNHLKAKDRRWKIEHAQVVQNQILIKLGIIPSVQPTRNI